MQRKTRDVQRDRVYVCRGVAKERECACVWEGGGGRGGKNRWTDIQTHMYID